MNEIKKILHTFDEIDFSKQKAALATVIKVEGSSYRSPGARMFITDNGRWEGSISGGCLEGDALRKSRKVMQSGIPQMVTYDTMDDENNTLGIGLGCNGIVHVLLEPIAVDDSSSMDLLKAIDQSEHLHLLVTVYSGNKKVPAGSMGLLDGSGEVTAGNLNQETIEMIGSDIEVALKTKKSETKRYQTANGPIELFIEIFEPPISLLVFGGGYDAKPVVALANSLGWQVSVVDECAAHLLPINFPSASLISCQRGEVSKNIEVKANAAVVLMSHNLKYDTEVLKQLIDTEAAYIGLLGPKKRTDKMFDQLVAEGFDIDKINWNDRLHSPIGLDIGADTPEEIALSIITEIKAKFAGRSGGFLKYRQGAIHTKDPKTGEVFKQVYLNGITKESQSG